MPVRTLNYTNRQRIRREDARISIRETRSGHVFDASLRLTDYGLPGDARVFVEAYRQTQYTRFDFGQVGAMHIPDDRLLQDFDFSEGILFRVKVVTAADPHGLLLAEADQIRPRRSEDADEDKRPLLECQRSRELGNEVWKVDLSGGAPVLLLNANLVNVLALERDPVFTALVAPMALRSIFTAILQGERDWDENDLTDWRTQWMHFAGSTLRMPEPPEWNDETGCEDWIDDASKAFCEKTSAVDLFNGYWTGAQEQ
jgi:hypothetical protein